MDSNGDADVDGPRKRRRINPPGTGPYVVRQLLDKVPVVVEEGQHDVHISCVEYWSALYLDSGVRLVV